MLYDLTINNLVISPICSPIVYTTNTYKKKKKTDINVNQINFYKISPN